MHAHADREGPAGGQHLLEVQVVVPEIEYGHGVAAGVDGDQQSVVGVVVE
ncbi:MAG: hypothetical protein ACRDRS_20690 [Pseudonocardiaceae bacterium]